MEFNMYQVFHYNNDGQKQILFKHLTYEQANIKLAYIRKNWGFSFYRMEVE